MFNAIEMAIGNALLTGRKSDQDLAIARAVVQNHVIRHIFCQRCETVMDQRSAAVLELHNDGAPGRTFAICGSCATSEEFNNDIKHRVVKSATENGLGVNIHTWSGSSELTLDDEDQPDPRQVELPLNHED
tara:strand:- start:141 stop:533 length:393 start_codon:yes stop_codon:yes gene_type:complete